MLLANLKNERWLWTATVGLILATALMPYLPHSSNRPDFRAVEARRFWMRKTFPPQKYSMLIGGDSRVYRGVAPAEMQTLLPNYSIFNFGFSSSSHSERMLKALDGHLDYNAQQPIIVLGLTPFSLTPEAAKDEHYLELISTPWSERMQRLYFVPILRWYEPTSPHEIQRAWQGSLFQKPELQYFQTYHDDGWVESYTVPADPNYYTKQLTKAYVNNTFSQTLFNNLLDWLDHWQAAGIIVVGFRPPTTEQTVALENKLSGYNQNVIAAAWKAHGALWCDFLDTDYNSYDGSHLEANSARAFSRDLASCIQTHLNRIALDLKPPRQVN